MSVESAKSFLKKVSKDKDFATKLSGAGSDDARKKVAQDAGFSFSKAELDQIAPGSSAKGAELSDKDLEAVAGGSTVGWVGTTASVVGAAAAAL